MREARFSSASRRRARRPLATPGDGSAGPFSRLSAGGFFPEAIHRKAPMRARTERRRRTRAARPRARRDTCGRALRDVRFRARVCARRRPVNRKAEPNLPHLEPRHLRHTDRCVQMTRRCRGAHEANSVTCTSRKGSSSTALSVTIGMTKKSHKKRRTVSTPSFESPPPDFPAPTQPVVRAAAV